MKFLNTFSGLCLAIFIFVSCGVRAQEHGAAQILFESANRERAANGLALLKWDPTLAAAAQHHAQRMAAQNTLSHQLPGEPDMLARAKQAGAHFSSLAENVAEGPSAESIHKQWMHSPPHRANLLDPQLNSIGIATAERGATLFAVEDFSLATQKLSLEEQEGMVEEKLKASGLQLLNYRADARRSCAMDNGFAGSHTPSFVLHYATPDLQSLPDMLNQRIATGKYHSAVVGACQSDVKRGLSNYRIAVLLFE
jgi:hypothetical protein